jgi:DNA-binding NarL/FixJ family response regulator
MELVAEQLGEQRYGELVAEHAGISIVEAIDLEPESVVPSPRPAAGDPDAFLPLTAREREVAELIANGKSNKAIAEALIVSPRTIDGHVERIFGKLGFRSRAQIAAWVSERKYPSASHE